MRHMTSSVVLLFLVLLLFVVGGDSHDWVIQMIGPVSLQRLIGRRRKPFLPNKQQPKQRHSCHHHDEIVRNKTVLLSSSPSSSSSSLTHNYEWEAIVRTDTGLAYSKEKSYGNNVWLPLLLPTSSTTATKKAAIRNDKCFNCGMNEIIINSFIGYPSFLHQSFSCILHVVKQQRKQQQQASSKPPNRQCDEKTTNQQYYYMVYPRYLTFRPFLTFGRPYIYPRKRYKETFYYDHHDIDASKNKEEEYRISIREYRHPYHREKQEDNNRLNQNNLPLRNAYLRKQQRWKKGGIILTEEFCVTIPLVDGLLVHVVKDKSNIETTNDNYGYIWFHCLWKQLISNHHLYDQNRNQMYDHNSNMKLSSRCYYNYQITTGISDYSPKIVGGGCMTTGSRENNNSGGSSNCYNNNYKKKCTQFILGSSTKKNYHHCYDKQSGTVLSSSSSNNRHSHSLSLELLLRQIRAGVYLTTQSMIHGYVMWRFHNHCHKRVRSYFS